MDSRLDDLTSVSKLVVNGQNLYIKILWENSKDSLFHINLYEGINSWTGRFSSDFANLVEEPKDEYNNNIRQAFTNNSDDFVFDFVCVPGASTAKLSWKKVFKDSTEMPYGCVDLSLDETESKDSFLDFLLDQNKELKGLVEVYDRKNTSLSEKVEQCKSELEAFVNEKTSLEANLYGKFAQLLNEKKERIRLLEETIQNLE